MNKFQKISLKIAKDCSNKESFKKRTVKQLHKECYKMFKGNRKLWPYNGCIKFRSWMNEKYD